MMIYKCWTSLFTLAATIRGVGKRPSVPGESKSLQATSFTFQEGQDLMHEFHYCPPIPELGESFQWRLLNGAQSGCRGDRQGLFDDFSRMAVESLKSMRVVEFDIMKEQLEEDGESCGTDCVEVFARQMAYSHVILLDSIFENFLYRACKTLAQARGKANMEFLSGKTLRRRYLERHAHVRVDAGHWEAAVLLSALRKVLVEGTSAAPSQLLARLDALDGLRVESHEVLVEPAYVQCVSSSLRQLMLSICSALEKTAATRQQEDACDTATNLEGFLALGCAHPRLPSLPGCVS